MLNIIQNQIFGMQWLNFIVGSFLTKLGFDTESRLGSSLNFFLYM